MANLHVESLDKKITALSAALAELQRGTKMTSGELLRIIHQPGWTTPAEIAFASAMVKAIQSHVAAITALQGDFLSASKLVTTERKKLAA